MNLSYLKKTFTPQLESSDCGVACLRSVVRYYGGDISLERLRELSGTNKQGTTLLGLYQAGQKLGLETEGYTAEIENLKEQTNPVILNVLIENRMQHYWVCYTYDSKKGFLIGDPAKGLDFYTEQQVSEAWQSKSLITLNPTEKFEKQESKKRQQWAWLWDLVQEDLTLLLISVVLGVAIAGLGLSTAIFSQKLIDDILPSQNQNKLIYGVALLAFLLLARTGLGYLRGFLLNRQSADFNNRIINRFFSLLLYLPKPFFDTRKTGDLVARMNDTRRIQSTISFLAGNVIIDVLVVGISTFYIFQYDMTIGLIALLSFPIYFLLMRLYHKDVRDSQREVMSTYAKNESNYIDTLQGIATIKSMNKEPLFEQVTKLIYGFFQQKIYALGLVRIRLSFWAELGSVLLIITVIAYCAFLVLQKSLQTGEMMAVLSIVGSLIPSVSRLVMLNIELQEAKVAFDRMFEFIGLKPEYQTVLCGGSKNLIVNELESLEVRNLNFRFTGRNLILENVSFEVKKAKYLP